MLIRAGSPADGHRRCVRVSARSKDPLDDLGRVMNAHEDDQRLGDTGLRPVDVVHIVAGDERDDGCVLAMRERYAGIRGDSERRGYARHDFEGDTGLGQSFHLFSAAAEDERIAALQANHGLALSRFGEHQVDDFGLRERVIAAFLADVDALGCSTARSRAARARRDDRAARHRPPRGTGGLSG